MPWSHEFDQHGHVEWASENADFIWLRSGYLGFGGGGFGTPVVSYAPLPIFGGAKSTVRVIILSVCGKSGYIFKSARAHPQYIEVFWAGRNLFEVVATFPMHPCLLTGRSGGFLTHVAAALCLCLRCARLPPR